MSDETPAGAEKPSLKGPIIALIIIPVISFGMFMTARDFEKSGKMPEYSGRRAGSKQLFASIATTLGTTGCLAIGVMGTLGAAGWLVSTIKKRANA